MSLSLTMPCQSLQKCLGHVQSVVEKRTTIPILANVLIDAKQDGTVTLCATDMDIEVIDAIAANVDHPGSITAPAHTLYDIIRKMPNDSDVSLTVNEAGTLMTVKSGKSVFNLGCLPRADFPEMSRNETPTQFDIPVTTLKEMIDRTRFAISTEETRYYLNGIYLHAVQAANDDDQPLLRAVATDGHRLAQYQVPCPTGAEAMPGIIIPRKTIGEIRKLADESGDIVRLSLSDKMIRFEMGSMVLTSKLIDGTFPDYQRVIPQNTDKSVMVDPTMFTNAVDRVSTVAAEKTRGIRLSIKEGTMTLSASNTDHGDATEELEVTLDGQPIDIGFNSKYLRDVTSLLAQNCQLRFSDPSSPTILQANDDPSSLYVLMPMRV